MDISCTDWLRSIFYCYLLSENSDDGNSDCCASAVVTKSVLNFIILDPRALVFYHVTDGDNGSGELHALVARIILVPRGRAPFGQHQESRPLAKSNTGSPRFTDFPSLCACSESSLTNLIGSGLNLLCLLSH